MLHIWNAHYRASWFITSSGVSIQNLIMVRVCPKRERLPSNVLSEVTRRAQFRRPPAVLRRVTPDRVITSAGTYPDAHGFRMAPWSAWWVSRETSQNQDFRPALKGTSAGWPFPVKVLQLLPVVLANSDLTDKLGVAKSCIDFRAGRYCQRS
jgi:hypothetical protein